MDRSQVQDIYELSPMQKGMLFHSLLDPEAGLYMEQFRGTLQGALEVSAFRQAWREVAERHPVLRTSFHWEDLEKPLQVVFADGITPLEFQDWSCVDATEVEARLEELERTSRLEPFDLAKAPLMRAQLICLGDGSHVFCWTYHHLLLDGWSLSIVLGELLVSYRSRVQSEAPSLEPVRPFSDYIGWLQGLEMDASEAYWRARLQGVAQPARAHWGGPVPERPVAASDLAEASLQLPAASAGRLRSFAATWEGDSEHSRPWDLAFLLARYGGHREALLVRWFPGRPGELPGADRMVGLFINTLPIRVSLLRKRPWPIGSWSYRDRWRKPGPTAIALWPMCSGTPLSLPERSCSRAFWCSRIFLLRKVTAAMGASSWWTLDSSSGLTIL